MGKEKILVVDDEEDILELITHNLLREGYDITGAESGEKALYLVTTNSFDLIVLDLMLPGLDGLEVAKRLKSSPDTRPVPIIMLTAKGEVADVVTGLEIGADDYITKPFSPRVLLARIKTVLRRGPEMSTEVNEVLRIHELEIHLGRREAKAGDHIFDLTFTEFQVLFHLAKRPGWVLSRSQIVDAVRGNNYSVTERSVDVQIVGLRKKMEHFGRYIETVRGVGYRFKEHL